MRSRWSKVSRETGKREKDPGFGGTVKRWGKKRGYNHVGVIIWAGEGSYAVANWDGVAIPNSDCRSSSGDSNK